MGRVGDSPPTLFPVEREALLLVRHATTAWNAERRYQGHVDVELSAAGRAEAQRLAAGLRDLTVDAILTSDLRRAVETAGSLAEGRQVPIQEDARLRERSFGRWEGLTFAEVESRYPEDVLAFRRDPAAAIGGGEGLDAVRGRAVAVLEAAGLKSRRLLVVAHGATIKTIIAHFMGWPLGTPIRVDNASLTVLERPARRPRLVALNVPAGVRLRERPHGPETEGRDRR